MESRARARVADARVAFAGRKVTNAPECRGTERQRVQSRSLRVIISHALHTIQQRTMAAHACKHALQPAVEPVRLPTTLP